MSAQGTGLSPTTQQNSQQYPELKNLLTSFISKHCMTSTTPARPPTHLLGTCDLSTVTPTQLTGVLTLEVYPTRLRSTLLPTWSSRQQRRNSTWEATLTCECSRQASLTGRSVVDATCCPECQYSISEQARMGLWRRSSVVLHAVCAHG